MRAWRVHHHGDPAEVLTLDHALPDPSPGPGELLVDVDVAALNFADSLLCRGTYQERPDLPFVPGLELVGRVVAAGAPAPGRTPGGRGAPPPVGTRVVGLAALPAGALADRALCHAAATFALPSAIDDAHAASLLVTYQTAWVGLHRRAALRPGEVVVVHGAAGGTGSAFVQVAVAAGARVIATAGGADKVARAVALGADVGIDSRAHDVVAAVRAATGGRGADVVVDPVGGDLFDASTRCVAWEGRILVVGFASGRAAEARTNHVMVKNYSVVGVHWPRYRVEDPAVLAEAHDALVAAVLDGRLVLPDPEIVPMTEARDAIVRLASGATVGKLVVDLHR